MSKPNHHLKNKVALVTGCSRGIGKGIAMELGRAGATVYLTGRRVDQSDNPNIPDTTPLDVLAKEIDQAGGKAIVVYCDHSDSEQIRQLFEQIDREQKGQLDILVNNAFSAVAYIIERIGTKFYEYKETPEYAYDTINNTGLRNNYICCVYAAKLMTKRNQGLILNVTSSGGANYFLGVAYGMGKEALDRMSADMAIELADKNITVLSYWVGAVKTELIHKIVLKPQVPGGVEVFANGQSIYYAGKILVELLKDPAGLHKLTGQIISTSHLGNELKILDIDGKIPGDARLDMYEERRLENNKVRLAALKK